MLYRFLKIVVALGIRTYYREIRIMNREQLDHPGPMILIANHPNTLMDAWIMGSVCRRRVHFMAKATFFNSPFKRWILNAIGMIPINRQSDSVTTGVNNRDSFEACYKLLEAGGILVIFPEGSSYLERRLREIKTGAARIALEAESRHGGGLDLLIIPVGLNYIDADSFRGSVMAHVGRPISADPFLEEYRGNAGQAAKKLTERFRTELSRVFVNMDDELKDQLSEQLSYIFDSRYAEEKGVKQSIGLLRQLQERMDVLAVSAPWKLQQIQSEASELSKSMALFGVKPHFLDRPFRRTLYLRQSLQSWLFLLLTVPIFLYGYTHNVVTYYLLGKLVPALSREIEYHAPLTVLLGLLLYPLTYLGWTYLFHTVFHPGLPILMCYAVSLPATGLFAHFFLRYVRHLLSKRQFSRFARERRTVFQVLKAQRDELKDLIFND